MSDKTSLPDLARKAGIGAQPYQRPPYRKCEFCGCRTNASLRACCDKGKKADEALRSKK